MLKTKIIEAGYMCITLCC